LPSSNLSWVLGPRPSVVGRRHTLTPRAVPTCEAGSSAPRRLSSATVSRRTTCLSDPRSCARCSWTGSRSMRARRPCMRISSKGVWRGGARRMRSGRRRGSRWVRGATGSERLGGPAVHGRGGRGFCETTWTRGGRIGTGPGTMCDVRGATCHALLRCATQLREDEICAVARAQCAVATSPLRWPT
jgi:hypothetical protein